MKLIPNWRRAWRMASVRVAVLAVGWGLLPPETQAAMLEAVGVPSERIPAVLGVIFLLLRLIDQPKVHDE